MSEGPRPTLAHRLEYLLLRGVIGLSGLLGEGGSARLGSALGRLAYRPLGIRRELVESQLRASFPDRDEAWIRRTAAGSYAHLGREGLAMLRLAASSPEEVRDRTEVAGLEELTAAVEAGRGVVLVTGHLGNWEIGGAALAVRGVPIDVIAQRQSNPLFDRLVVETRERLGMRVIPRGRATRDGVRSLRSGRVVAFVADQDAKGAGAFVPFFGRLASTHRGPALLALRTGAPLFVARGMLRTAEGRYRTSIEELKVDRDGEVEEVVHRMTAAFTAALEEGVRTAPDQYFWQHRRWKSRPPEERPAGAPV